jgi:hypothetical protein
MDQRVVLQVLWTAKRMRALEQLRAANWKKHISQQEHGFKARPASGTVADADVNSLRGEVNEPSASVDPQVKVGSLHAESLHARQQPLVRERRGTVTMTAICAWTAFRRSKPIIVMGVGQSR